MSDVNANIGIHFDTNDALAQLRRLQAGLSKFNQALTQGNVAAENAQKGLNAQLMQSINATGKFVASQKTVSTSTASFTEALEKNKLSMREYFRYTAAAATANTKILKGAFSSEREIINRARKDRVKALQTQYIQLTDANGQLVKTLQIVPKHLRMVNGEYADYATRVQMAAQRQQLMNQLLKQGSTQLLNFGKNTQWAGRQLMVGITVPLTMLGGVAAKAFQEMEEAVIKFTRVYGDMTTSVSDTNKAVEGIQRLAKEFTKYGIAAADTVKMAADAAAMGLTGSDLTAQVTAATKLSVLGQVEQQAALQTTISLQNAFGISADQLAQKINFLNAVENQTVLSIEDLTTAIPKAGPVVKQLGGNVEDLAFFMTAMKEGGINASEGANALKSGLASLINPSKKASEMLSGFGINIKGIVDANAGNLKGTVVGFARALDELDPLNRARAIETMFGKFQFARLSTLFQNITKDSSQAARALGLASASVEELAILSERELGKVEDAVGTKFKKQMEDLKLQLVPIGKAFLEAITPIVKFASSILERFNNLSVGTKKFVVMMLGFLGGIAPVALMTFGVVANGVANLIKFFAMLRGGMAKLNGQNSVLGGGFDYLTQQEIENLAQAKSLHNAHQDLIATFNIEKTSVDALAAAYANAASQARTLASGSPGLFNAVPGPAGAVSGLPKFANGKVPGNPSDGDSVLALVQPGETIVPTKLSEKYGPVLGAIMQDKLPGFSTGYSEFATQSDRTYAASAASGSSSSEGYITSELGRIRKMGSAALLRYAEAVGIDVADASEESLEKIRDVIISELKDIVQEAKDTLGSASEENIAKIGKRPDPQLKSWVKGELQPGSSRMGQWAPKFNQLNNQEFSHVGQTQKLEATKLSLTPEAQAQVEGIKEFFTLQGKKMPELRVADAHAMTIAGKFNNAMSSEGKARGYEKKNGAGSLGKDFEEEFTSRGVEKWQEMTVIMGEDFDRLKGQAKIYDDALAQRLKEWNAVQERRIADGLEPELMTDDVFAELELEVRQGIKDQIPEWNAVIESAKQVITELRLSVGEETAQLNAFLESKGLGTVGKQKGNTKVLNTAVRGNAETGKREGEFLGTQPLHEGVKTDVEATENFLEMNSPSKRTKRIGIAIGDGLKIGLEESTAGVKAQSDKMAKSAVPTIDTANKAKYDALKNEPDQRQIQKSIDRHYRGIAGKTNIPVPQNATETETSLTVEVNPKALASDILAAKEARKKAIALDKEASAAEAAAAKMRAEAAKWEEIAARENNQNVYTTENVKVLNKQAEDAELKAAQLRIQAAEEKAKATALSQQNGSDGSIEAEVAKSKQEQLEATKDAAREAKKAAKKAGDVTKAQNEIANVTKKSSKQQQKNADSLNSSTIATINATEQIAGNKISELSASELAVIKETENANNLVTANNLEQQILDNKENSVGNGNSINKIENDIKQSEASIAESNDKIEENKRRQAAEGRAAVNAKYNPIIPDSGPQTSNKYVNLNTAMSYEDAYDEASTYLRDDNGQIVFDKETKAPTSLTKKQLNKKYRDMRAEKVGRVSGKISGGLGTAAMVAGMAGAPPQVTAALGAAATISQFAPMLAKMSGPQGVAATIVAIGASAYLLNKHLEAAAVAQAKYVESISANTDKMKKIGEITGKVGASELMAKKRDNGLFDTYNVANRAGSQFGDTFLQSDIGKSITKSFVDNMRKSGSPQAAKDLALELSAYISDGVMTAEQANSIANQIGINLKSKTFTARIQGELRMLVGPNGEDILKDPIKARMDIIEAAADRGKKAMSDLEKVQKERADGILGFFRQNKSGRAEAAQLSAYDSNTLEIAQAQADAVAKIYDDKIRTLKAELAATTNKEKQLKLEQEIAKVTQEGADNAALMNQKSADSLNRAINNFKNTAQSTSEGGAANFYTFGATGDGIFNNKGRAKLEDSYFDSLKAQVKDKYEGTGLMPIAQDVMSRAAKISDNGEFSRQGFKTKEAAQELEVKINMLMATGIMTPSQEKTMMDLFDGNLNRMNTVLDIGIKTHGASKIAELSEMLNVGADKKTVQDIILRVTKRSPKDFDRFSRAIASMSVLDGHEIDMQVAINILKQEGLDKLSKDLEKVDAIKSPITKEVITKFIQDNKDMPGMNEQGMDLLMSKWTDWDKLPDAVKKEAISKYETIYQTTFLDEPARLKFMEDYAKKKAKEASQGGKITQVYDMVYQTTYQRLAAGGEDALKREYAAEATNTYLGDKPTIESLNGDGKGAGDGTRDTTYDDLLKRLRNVRLATIDASKGFDELRRAMAKTGIKAINDQFLGLEQQLIKLGSTQQFTDFLAGLDQEELNKYGKAATKKGINPITGKKDKSVKKGDFILNDKGKLTEAGINKAIQGDYNKAQLLSITLSKQEIAARNKLVALGYNQEDIQTMIADENYRTLIATGKITDAELKTNAALTAQARIRSKISSLFKTGQDAQNVADNQKRIPEVVKMLQEGNVSAEGIRKAISDPAMLDQLITGMDNFDKLGKDAQDEFSKALDFINAIPDQKIVELVFTQTDAQKQIAGANAAAELFDMYKTIDENTITNDQGNTYAGLQVQMEDLNNQAKIVQNAINITQSQIDGLQLEVDSMQRDIETRFTRPIEQKQRAIDKLNRAAELNFVRPIQALQDRSTVLSHDLDVMNHAAEQINEKYDRQGEALSKVSEINQQIIQQQQQQIGLADALSQGDIAAAARAAQEMRASDAANYAQGAEKALQQSRENEINALRGGVSGKSQKDIQEEQYQIGQQIYGLERGKAASDAEILKIQDEIYALEQGRLEAQDAIQVKMDDIAKIQFGILLNQQADLKAINDKILPLQQQSDLLFKQIADNDKIREISGLTRTEWEAIRIAAEASEKVASGELARALGTADSVSGSIKSSWDDIRSAYDAIVNKSIQITQKIVTEYGPGVSQPGSEDSPVDTYSIANEIENEIRDKYKGQIITDSLKTEIDNQVQAQLDALATEAGSRGGNTGAGVLNKLNAMGFMSRGGLVPKYFAAGGFARGTDTIPAMLTPGEFVMSRYAVDNHGLDRMKAINSGAPVGETVYNYSLTVNAKSDASPDDIARTVMAQIKQIDSQKIRGNRF